MILTSPLRRVNSVLQRGTNISVCEICAKWLVFSGTVTYVLHLSACYVCDYRIVLKFRGSKFSRIAVFVNFVEIFS